MHRLLQRQLARYLEGDVVPDSLKALLAAIDDAYTQSDLDRAMVERSLELSSQELLDANAELNAILRASPDWVLHVTEDGMVSAHRAGRGEHLFRTTPRPGISIRALLPPEVALELERSLGEVFHPSGEPRALEYASDSTPTRYGEVRVIPFMAREALLVIRDVTDRVEGTRRREHAEHARAQMLREFAHVASHDLRAPLRTAATLASFIIEDVAEGRLAELDEHARTLAERIAGLDALIEALLEYSEVGQHAARVESVDCTELVRHVARILGPPERFDIRVDGPLPTLDTVRSPLERVFLNLIGNAIKHHDRPAGTIMVSGGLGTAEAVFEVADDGPGIAGPQREHAFKMFTRLGTKKVEGSGMGLALVRRIVESAGGSIRVLDNEPRGLRFEVRWPRVWPRAPES